LLSSGNLGSALIAHAALCGLLCWHLGCLGSLVFVAVALAFGATASAFKHKVRAFCKALMPRSISASSCFVLIQNPPLMSLHEVQIWLSVMPTLAEPGSLALLGTGLFKSSVSTC
jgi:hypothetical protein